MVYKCSVRGCVQLNLSQERVPHYAFPLSNSKIKYFIIKFNK